MRRARAGVKPRVVELRGGNAHVEQNAVHRLDPEAREHIAKLGEGGMDHGETAIGNLSCCTNGGGVTVQPDQPAVRAEPAENRPAVAAAPERAIDIGAVRAYPQRCDSLLQQHRHVLR